LITIHTNDILQVLDFTTKDVCTQVELPKGTAKELQALFVNSGRIILYQGSGKILFYKDVKALAQRKK